MIQLPNITLICVATRDIANAVKALEYSCKGISWGAIKLICSEHYTDSAITQIIIPPFETIDDWNKFIFYNLHEYVDTEFCLLIHPDGYVIHPEKWDSRFLDYDYVGAPWPESESFRDIYGNMIRVGNSVSIRSKRLLELPTRLQLPWNSFHGMTNEDTAICVHYRHHFLEDGINFAPVEIAALFAHEIPVPENEGITPFAFHHWEPLIPKFSMNDIYASYINLDSRPDRDTRMIDELNRVHISAERLPGILPHATGQPSDKIHVMYQRTPGAIGCHYSQIAVMEKALSMNKHALVMEDDLVFCDDIQERFDYIEQFLSNNEWDIMWLGGTYHSEPTWHKNIGGKHTHPDLQMCSCDLNRDWEPTHDPHIVRTYGCWSTYAYIVNKKRLAHILDLLDQNVYRSMGIDWLFILLQPQLYTFAFNPGCVRQYNNQSNIGSGITDFDSFRTLGSHWFSNTYK